MLVNVENKKITERKITINDKFLMSDEELSEILYEIAMVESSQNISDNLPNFVATCFSDFLDAVQSCTKNPTSDKTTAWIELALDLTNSLEENCFQEFADKLCELNTHFSDKITESIYDNPNMIPCEIIPYANYLNDGGSIETANKLAENGSFMNQALNGKLEEPIISIISSDNIQMQ